jgi:pimeloyl-ACP methyl ester carboxylesterase
VTPASGGSAGYVAGHSAGHLAGPAYELRGLRAVEHRFSAPLDHTRPDGETIALFAREYVSLDHAPEAVEDLPWLLFLQGGPGGRGARAMSLNGWMKAAARNFRILMLDQRGTGLSTPVNRQTLPGRGDARAQAAYLSLFRADSIVADAELIRKVLVGGPWSIFGQSFGGFCALTYLSFAPDGLREALITGGLAPLAGSPDRVYEMTFQRVAERNAEYFAKYPQDRGLATRIARHLETVPEYLPTGERLTARRFQMAGSFLGGNTRFDGLHYLLEDAFLPTAEGPRLSDTFLQQLGGLVSRAANPLYAVLHESIYCQGEASNWAAARVLRSRPEFLPDADEPLFTGEMIYPWYFDEDPALRPLKEAAELLAAKDDWPPLYDRDRLIRNAVPVAAAVYRDDIYVDRTLSLETAAMVKGLQVWETADFHHDGISDDGAGIFTRLLRMCRGLD